MSEQMARINVYPNPYFGHNKAEANPLQRFVTFSNLPANATIRVFNLLGDLVTTIHHDDATSFEPTFERWDLRNDNGLPVASGMYIVHIEVEAVGDRILKVAIIQPEERPTRAPR